MKKIILYILFIFVCIQQIQSKDVIVGAQRTEQYLPLLKGKSVGLVINQTSVITVKNNWF